VERLDRALKPASTGSDGVTMRMYAYIRVLSDEATIHKISKEADIPDADIQRLKAPRDEDRDERCWHWLTPRVSIDVDDVDAGLKALLTRYRPMFPTLQRHRGTETDVYLEIVTTYEKNERPRGLYLSGETISLVSELGGAIDNDVETLEG
jgi:hypothetical protein